MHGYDDWKLATPPEYDEAPDPAAKCAGCSQPATRRDADDVADVCDSCGEASDDQKRDREKRLRRMAEREEI